MREKTNKLLNEFAGDSQKLLEVTTTKYFDVTLHQPKLDLQCHLAADNFPTLYSSVITSQLDLSSPQAYFQPPH